MSLLRSSAFRYIFIRYVTYIIQFLNSILIARLLGSYQYGIYSFILLYLQYYSYTNLGLNSSFNIIGASFKKDVSYFHVIWSNAFLVNLILCIIFSIISLFFCIYPFEYLIKYDYQEYALLLAMVAPVINLNNLFVTLYKLHAKLDKVNLYQLLPNLLILVVCIIDFNLSIKTIMYCFFIANFISLCVFFYLHPQKVSLKFDYKIIKDLISRGISLLLYNLSSTFLKSAVLTVISFYFSVTTMGIYSFANVVSNAVVMLGGAVMFIFYPKILSKYVSANKEQASELSKNIDNTYIIAINIICFTSLLAYSLLTFFIYEFLESMQIYKVLLLSQIFMNSSTSSSIFLISQKKEFYLVYIGCLSIVISIIVSVLLCYIDVDIEIISLTILFSSLIYSSLILILEKKLCKDDINLKLLYHSVFKGTAVPALLILLSICIEENVILIFLALMLYVYTCKSKLRFLVKTSLNIFSNNNMLKF